MKKLLIFFAACSIFIGCNSNAAGSKNDLPTVAAEPELPGKMIFTKNCKLCHGADGTLGVSGAANLSISALTLEEKIQVITNGRRGMASWKSILTPEEIRMVAMYVETLRK